MLFDQLIGKVFHVIRSAPGINGFGDMGFLLQENLRVPGNFGRKISGKGYGFIQRIRMKRLGAASVAASASIQVRATLL